MSRTRTVSKTVSRKNKMVSRPSCKTFSLSESDEETEVKRGRTWKGVKDGSIHYRSRSTKNSSLRANPGFGKNQKTASSLSENVSPNRILPKHISRRTRSHSTRNPGVEKDQRTVSSLSENVAPNGISPGRIPHRTRSHSTRNPQHSGVEKVQRTVSSLSKNVAPNRISPGHIPHRTRSHSTRNPQHSGVEKVQRTVSSLSENVAPNRISPGHIPRRTRSHSTRNSSPTTPSVKNQKSVSKYVVRPKESVNERPFRHISCQIQSRSTRNSEPFEEEVDAENVPQQTSTISLTPSKLKKVVKGEQQETSLTPSKLKKSVKGRSVSANSPTAPPEILRPRRSGRRPLSRLVITDSEDDSRSDDDLYTPPSPLPSPVTVPHGRRKVHFENATPTRAKRSRKRPRRKTLALEYSDDDEYESDREETCMISSIKRKRKDVSLTIPERMVAKGRRSGVKVKEVKFETARERLHVSAIPETIPCREREFVTMCNFVEDKLLEGTGGCMYISGVPGTGKTATVHEVAQYLKQAADEDSLPPFKFVEINGLRLTEPRQLYVTMLKELTGEMATPDHASLMLNKYFNSSKKKPMTVLLADEVDQLWTKKQSILYELFDWPSWQTSGLIVLAVSNTMDLPEKDAMMHKVSSRLGLARLTFQPYTHQQLQEIIISRMTGLNLFETDAIQLAARKVAAVSGDARRALDICRRAIEIAQMEAREKRGRGQKKGVGLVGMPHLQKAIEEMFSSPKILAIKHVSAHEKLVLRAVVTNFHATGVEQTTFDHMCDHLKILWNVEGVRPLNMTMLHQLVTSLGMYRLLLVEEAWKGMHRKIRLNVSVDDVMFALK